jgi:tRNA(Ile)-lysidine synthase
MRRESMLPARHRVVVGVSGGPDSLCLLHLLWTQREKLGIRVHAAHLNHLIRGADADADAQFVSDQAARWGVPCTVEARNVPAVARQRGLAIEEAARRVRYVYLAQVACQVGATRIAVGHNADDQSETVLMHWLRGAGLAGLRGMLPATRMTSLRLLGEDAGPCSISPDEAQNLWLIRPLLETPRAQIEEYCRRHSLTPRFDRSNLDTTLYRNKLRHELLPYLERAFKPGLNEILRRSARVIRDDYDLLCAARDRAWTEIVRHSTSHALVLDRERWQALHPSLQRATLRYAVQHLRRTLRDVNYVHTEAATRVARQGAVGSQATLPKGVVLTIGYSTLTVADSGWTPSPDFPALSTKRAGSPERISLAVPGTTSLGNQTVVEIQIASHDTIDADWQHNTDPWRAYLDADVLGQELYVRRRQAGDRFRPLGLGGQHKLVSDLMINAKIPAWWRDRVPLLVRADDTVMWVCGWRVDERAKVCQETARVAVICLRLEG